MVRFDAKFRGDLALKVFFMYLCQIIEIYRRNIES